MSLIKLSNGVEVSEETVINALEKQGVNVQPKHIFKPGDVAQRGGSSNSYAWRFIVWYDGKLLSFDEDGAFMSEGQAAFENEKYKFVGKQKDLLKK